MSHRAVPLKLAPAGLVVHRHEIGTAGIIVHVHGASPTSACPACGLASSSVHSRYGRTLGDLPAHGRRLRIRLAARRFRCRNPACERRVFRGHVVLRLRNHNIKAIPVRLDGKGGGVTVAVEPGQTAEGGILASDVGPYLRISSPTFQAPGDGRCLGIFVLGFDCRS